MSSLAANMLRLLSNKKVQGVGSLVGGTVAAETHLPKKKEVGKTARIRLDSNIQNFELDLFKDLDMARFIKVVVPLTSINPLSAVVDMSFFMMYFYDMISDINGDVDVQEEATRMADIISQGVTSLIKGEDVSTASFSITIFSPLQDMIWPESFVKSHALREITSMPYYLSAELLRFYAKELYFENGTLVVKY